jgi:hypothetical protein
VFINFDDDEVLYTNIQSPIHTNPKAPMMINAHSQPIDLAMKGIVTGAKLHRCSRIPNTGRKSSVFLGKYSAVVLIAAGKFPLHQSQNETCKT